MNEKGHPGNRVPFVLSEDYLADFLRPFLGTFLIFGDVPHFIHYLTPQFI